MNTTETNSDQTYNIRDYYIVCSLSLTFAIISVVICVTILILVCRTKSRLHTVNHLLLCNTCIASICYCIIINNNYMFLIFIPSVTSVISCRLRAYFAYIGITGVVYSYVIQAISRLFFSFLTVKYRWLTSFKAHYYLIAGQWLVVTLITSPAILTNDITYYPQTLCWVPLDRTVHVGYTVFAYYIMPVCSIVIIYIYIYYRVRRTIKEATMIANTMKRQKMNLELLRNILILVCIYLGGGLPFLLFVVTSIRNLYLVNLVTLSLTVAVEKIFTIVLDRELRQVIRSCLRRQILIMPFDNTVGKVRSPFQGKLIQSNNALQLIDTTLRL